MRLIINCLAVVKSKLIKITEAEIEIYWFLFLITFNYVNLVSIESIIKNLKKNFFSNNFKRKEKRNVLTIEMLISL